MSAGGKERSGSPTPPEARPPESDGLLTSEELFGEFVDGPLPQAKGGGTQRSGPIRVQVSDPVSPAPFAVPGDESGGSGTDAEVESAFNRLGSEPKPVRFRPAGPVFDDEEARLPPAALSTSAKLMVTDPKLPIGPGLDLASVAESAISVQPTDSDPHARRRGATTASARISSSTVWR